MNTQDFDYVRQLVHDQAAIVLSPEKEYLVEARLNPLARDEGYNDLADFVTALRGAAGSVLRNRVIEAMTTNETSFFRDVRPFDCLRDHILPKIIEERRTKRELRIWSAACSSGQEAYSIGMLLRDKFPELAGWKIEIFCTDISDKMLTRVRDGVYSQLEVNRGLPAAYLPRFFRRKGLKWQANDDIRNMMNVQHLNFADLNWGIRAKYDVVFLRNVLIYFNTDSKTEILGRLRKCMSDDAALFLGSAETTLGLATEFVRHREGGASFYRLHE